MTALGRGAAASALLAESGSCTMRPGLTDTEIRAIEALFCFTFNDEHREFLATGLPTGPSWPDWRDGDTTSLAMHLGLPARDILGAVANRGLWRHGWGERRGDGFDAANRLVAKSPRMIPVYGHGFTPEGAGRRGVWSISDGEANRAAVDLLDFVRLQRGEAVSPPQAPSSDRLPFWDDFADDPDPAVPRHLSVPPFRPDPPPPASHAIPPPRDPATTFAELGVELAELTRHDEVLAHGAPLWITPVRPGRHAITTWDSARAVASETGLWPVLFTERTWHRIGADGVPDHQPLLSAELNGAAWLSAEYGRRTRDEPLPRGWEPWIPSSAHWLNEWSKLHDVERYDRLALIPTPAHWLVPGLLQWSGAVNYDVGGIEHAAILRRWSGRWGAELVALDDETEVLRLASPPRLYDEAPPLGAPPTLGIDALEAAVEAYLYCPDSVDVGPDGVDALAPLLTGRLWVFWWD